MQVLAAEAAVGDAGLVPFANGKGRNIEGQMEARSACIFSPHRSRRRRHTQSSVPGRSDRAPSTAADPSLLHIGRIHVRVPLVGHAELGERRRAAEGPRSCVRDCGNAAAVSRDGAKSFIRKLKRRLAILQARCPPLRCPRPVATSAYVDSGRTVADFPCRNPRHDHARRFRIKPANPVAANDKIRRIENVIFDEIQHRTVDLWPLCLHQIEYEFRRSVAALMHNADSRIIAFGNGLESGLEESVQGGKRFWWILLGKKMTGLDRFELHVQAFVAPSRLNVEERGRRG